ncbi:rna recognition motif-containing protein [Cystoisospora suis]|uniref:Rna recognition motif-containing protein n=1 Tax=Cystoisospora suis TaxID=483139 RepID=A0A2C6KG71_9APIC|nr:rna recognition motif-containing protein [Cystoisospora suis]
MFHVPVAAVATPPVGMFGPPAGPVAFAPSPFAGPPPGASPHHGYPPPGADWHHPGPEVCVPEREPAGRHRGSPFPGYEWAPSSGRRRTSPGRRGGDARSKSLEENKVFIGNLSQRTTTESLTAYMTRFGLVDDAVVMIDKATGASRGFGFVTFAEGSAVSACVRADQHIIDGQDVDIRRAVPRGQPVMKAAEEEMQNKVFIGGVPDSVTEDRLASFFSERFGAVKKVSLMHDKHTGRSRGFGFVTFQYAHSAQHAVGRHDIDGHMIEAKKAEPRFGVNKASSGSSESERRGEDRSRRSEYGRGGEDAFGRSQPAPLYGAGPPIDGFGLAEPLPVDAYPSGPMRRGHYPPPQAARPTTRGELDGYTNPGGGAPARAYAAPADPYASMAPGLHYAPGAAAAATSPSAGSPATPAGVFALPAAAAAAASNPYTTAGAPAGAAGAAVHGVTPASMYSQLYPAGGVGAEPVAATDGYGQYVASPLTGSGGADPYDLGRSAVGRQGRYGRSGSRVHPY